MIGSTLRLELETEGRTARPTFIGPASAAAYARNSPIAVAVCRRFRRRQIGIWTAGQSRVIPVTTPFVDVSVHVVNSPGVRGITTNFLGAAERRTFRRAVIWNFAVEVCLQAAQLIAERSRGSGSSPPRVFPL